MMNIRFRFILVITIAVFSGSFLFMAGGKSINGVLLNSRASILPLVKQNPPENKVDYYKLKRVENYCEPEISAKGVIAVYIDEANNVKQIVFEKNADEKLPIASITKLMTAVVALDNYSLDEKVTITKEAVNQEGDNSKLKVGEEFTVKDLLYLMLIESDNGAAYAFSEKDGIDLFVKKMNDRAKNIGLNSTVFFNSTGLDPDNPRKEINQSTAKDIYLLTEYLLSKPLIWEILMASRINFYSPGNIFHHEVVSTNEFLEKRLVSWKDKIVGGKTGWTPMANGCLMLTVSAQNGKGKIIAVILGSDDRFRDMEKLIDWTFSNYR